MEEKTDAGHGLRQICRQRKKGSWRLGKDCDDVGLGSFYEVTRGCIGLEMKASYFGWQEGVSLNSKTHITLLFFLSHHNSHSFEPGLQYQPTATLSLPPCSIVLAARQFEGWRISRWDKDFLHFKLTPTGHPCPNKGPNRRPSQQGAITFLLISFSIRQSLTLDQDWPHQFRKWLRPKPLFQIPRKF
jgi:hypothetical protein